MKGGRDGGGEGRGEVAKGEKRGAEIVKTDGSLASATGEFAWKE